MKIKNVSCTQFAGIRDRSISFGDGINVVFGENESGKSTLVNLISRTLFQNERIDGRSDKSFRDLYFPSAVKNSSFAGDFADGKITFETDEGIYTLTKEWGRDGVCKLSAPKGVTRDPNVIERVLKEALVYGEGVYADMIFSPQSSSARALETLLDVSKKTESKQEITDAVSKAFSESDGISSDVIEEAINEKIEEIAGKHWDFEKGEPMRKAGRWASGLGEILKAYYALKDAEDTLETISSLEKECAYAESDYANKDKAAKKAEAVYNDFNSFANRLAVQNERRKAMSMLESEFSKLKEILTKWPELEKNTNSAKELLIEKNNRDIIDKYELCKGIDDEIKALKTEIEGITVPDNCDIVAVKGAQQAVTVLENSLCGMNLNAAVNLFGENKVEITSLRTGKKIDVKGDTYEITEAVRIFVPGVIEMTLFPSNVNIDDAAKQIVQKREIIASIFEKYSVETLGELEELSDKIAKSDRNIETLGFRLAAALGGFSYEDIKSAAERCPTNVRARKDIDDEISLLCKDKDIGAYIAANETVLGGYVCEHGNFDALSDKVQAIEAELCKVRRDAGELGDIPKEYLNISDPDAHRAMLQDTLKQWQGLRETALTAKTSAQSRAEGYKDSLSGDPEQEAQKARRVYDETKALLYHWVHIKEVFERQKANIKNEPMKDISEKFTEYLSVISNGKVSCEFPNGQKLNMNIYSSERLLDYGKLSEGTKDTVSLAFRLAVLDHLFPDGGGVIVLDDPFTDMDAERTTQACELVKKCAKKHQVIFLTCKEEYVKMLDGERINIQSEF